jgi:hypothetical protein
MNSGAKKELKRNDHSSLFSLPTTIKAQVLGISTVTDIETNEPTAVITFGKLVEVTDQIRRNLPESQRAIAPPKLGTQDMILLMRMKGVVPYGIGSSWVINIDDNGRLVMETTTA